MNTRHEILFTQLETYRSELLAVVEHVTHDQAEVIPPGFRNNIRWNLGHILLDQYLWIQAVTKEPIAEAEPLKAWFGWGTTPANFTEETPTLSELVLLLKEQPARIRNLYGHRLEEEFAPTEMGMNTIEQVLIRTIFHEGMHLQAILDIKRFL